MTCPSSQRCSSLGLEGCCRSGASKHTDLSAAPGDGLILPILFQALASPTPTCHQPGPPHSFPSSPGLFEFTAHLKIKANRVIHPTSKSSEGPCKPCSQGSPKQEGVPLGCSLLRDWDLAPGSPSTMEPEVGRWGRLWPNHWHQPLHWSPSRTRTVNSSGVICWAQALVA